jgi:hypothetical protein
MILTMPDNSAQPSVKGEPRHCAIFQRLAVSQKQKRSGIDAAALFLEVVGAGL